MRRAAAVSVMLSMSLFLPTHMTSRPRWAAAPRAVPNANSASAGKRSGGVLSLGLEAKRAVWYPDGDSLPGREVMAFSEGSGAATVPGPLVRVPAGTTVDLTVRNTLDADSIVFHVPPEVRGNLPASDADSVVVAPGERAVVRFVAAVPGNYLYRARTNDRLARALRVGGLMAGAIVVDSAGVTPPRDRVMVLLASTDSAINGTPADNVIFSINGQ